MGIDLSRFKVIHGEKVLNAVALMDVIFDNMDFDKRKTVEKPKFIDVLAINEDGNIVSIRDEAWTFLHTDNRKISETGKDQTIMKVSEFLKKVGTIEQAEIWIEFKENKKDTNPERERLTGNTPEEQADQVIKRASGYTLQEVNINENAVIITAVKIEKRTPKPKSEKVQDEKREEQKQAIAEELERLDQAVAVLIETIVAPFRRIGQRENRKRGGILAALKNARAAVRRILTRVFGRGGGANV